MTCKIAQALVLLFVLALGPATAIAAEPGLPTTEAIARNCMGCHGLDGKSPAAMPTIAGKSAGWMARRLLEFRSGEAESTIMGRIMKPFADEDIRNIADYFAARK